ncbi:hypothetical protein BX600DRAFT_518743 [Xylariales sp. PMI_506]|nr:hypothetical protein BX600DRAFT_518743 [Xylariales sp. PMI_506]
MAPSIPSPSNASSSPARFGSPYDANFDLRPEPLRLPPRNIISSHESNDVNVSCEVPQVWDLAPDTTVKTIVPPRPTIAGLSSHLCHKTSMLGSLVSKFEILDAVNNVDSDQSPRVPWLFHNETSPSRFGVKALGFHSSEDRAITRLQIPAHHSTPSGEVSNALEGSLNLSPREVWHPQALAPIMKHSTAASTRTRTVDNTSDFVVETDSPNNSQKPELMRMVASPVSKRPG